MDTKRNCCYNDNDLDNIGYKNTCIRSNPCPAASSSTANKYEEDDKPEVLRIYQDEGLQVPARHGGL